jgi:hypothetical protein
MLLLSSSCGGSILYLSRYLYRVSLLSERMTDLTNKCPEIEPLPQEYAVSDHNLRPHIKIPGQILY